MRKLVFLATFFAFFLVVPLRGAVAAPRYINMEIGIIAPNVANSPSKVWVFVEPQVEGDPVPTGAIKLTFLGNTLGTDAIHYCPAVELSCATIMVPDGLVAGDIELNASYAGDANYSAMSTGPVDVEILMRDTSATLASSVGAADNGTPVTLAFQLTKVDKFPVAHLPGGNVEFWDRTTNTYLGGAALKADWTAGVALRDLKAGTHAIDATYKGGDGFSPVKTGTVSVVINNAPATKKATTSAAPSTTAPSLASGTTTPSTMSSTESTIHTNKVQQLATTPITSARHTSNAIAGVGIVLLVGALALLTRNSRRLRQKLANLT